MDNLDLSNDTSTTDETLEENENITTITLNPKTLITLNGIKKFKNLKKLTMLGGDVFPKNIMDLYNAGKHLPHLVVEVKDRGSNIYRIVYKSDGSFRMVKVGNGFDAVYL